MFVGARSYFCIPAQIVVNLNCVRNLVMIPDYFALFELPVSFEVDLAELNRNYIALQKRYHPDFHAGASPEVLDEVMRRSSMLNDGLQELRNPDSRMRYLLQLKGRLGDEEKYTLPPDFLMEMMELNEEEDAEARMGAIRSMQQEMDAAIAPILAAYREGEDTAYPYDQVKDYYFRKKYLRRILDKTAG